MGIREEIQGQWRFGGTLKRLLFINIGVFLALRSLTLIAWLGGKQGLDLLALDQLMSRGDAHWLMRHPWTVITYMFTHFDARHIIWNMITFWFSGQLFQGLLGERRLLGNYILGGISGFALYMLLGLSPAHLQLGSDFPILGASAAVMSVLVGIAAYQPDMEVSLMFAGNVKLKYVAIVFLILDLISISQGDNSGGHVAHLGGALYGFMAARQLKNGNDWSLGFVNGLDRMMGLFTFQRKPRMRVEKRPGVKQRVMQDMDFNRAKKDKQERVDAILDKISRSGYDSLSKEERDVLFKASHDK